MLLPVFLDGQSDISFEFQAYPTGLIPGLSIDKYLNGKMDVYFRGGYNWIRHRDLGKHEDERGSGIGVSVGFKRYFKEGRTGWKLGIKNDLWWNSIEWTEGSLKGMTDITVVQPTAELSYVFRKSNFHFAPSIAFGYEVNVKTEGEETGEGAILLMGFQIGRRL